MRLTLFLCVGLALLAACKSKPPPSASDTTPPVASTEKKKPASDFFEDPSAAPEVIEEAPNVAAAANLDGGVRVDEAFFAKYLVTMGDQLERDARAAAKRKFKSPEEALAALEGLTPEGFRVGPEMEKKLGLTDIDHTTLGPRMAAFAEAHPDLAERESKKLAQRMDRPVAEVLRNIDKQFPDAGFTMDPSAP
jgi:hypothetical protein